MSILYKAIAKTQPGVVGGGQIKYYAGIVRERPVNIRKIATDISGMCTLTSTDVFAVLESFLDRIHTYIEEGRIVKLGDLGSFSPALASQGEDEQADVDRSTIKKLRVNFRPSAELKSRLIRVTFEKHYEVPNI